MDTNVLFDNVWEMWNFVVNLSEKVATIPMDMQVWFSTRQHFKICDVASVWRRVDVTSLILQVPCWSQSLKEWAKINLWTLSMKWVTPSTLWCVVSFTNVLKVFWRITWRVTPKFLASGNKISYRNWARGRSMWGVP